MKRNYFSYFLISIIFVIGMMASCTKEGPAGPAGKDGADGTNGSDGKDGVDGNVSCLVCHTAANMGDIHAAFDQTKHVTGSSWARGTSGSCGRCHSSDGFIEFARSGEEIGAAVSTPVTCQTCHADHSSLEDGISAPMRSVASPVVSIAIEGATYEHGMGNTCATCHQARRASTGYDNKTEDATYSRKFTGEDIAVYQAHGAIGPNGTMELVGDTLFVTFDVPTTHVYTSSTHAGPHHGPQANIFAADIGTVAGAPFDRDHHTDCAGCHLSKEEGSGHTFSPNIAMCNECHGDALDIEAEMAAIADRMHAVEVALEGIGAIHVADDGVHPMYASLPRDEWNAFWNFMCLWEDKSHGLHNFGYAKQLLTQAETALGL
ncbi:MAG: hypothetical protein C0598_10945 [Marinilabiliales bacterium]|nr:MAG: hypothetical protein C0598_10945 [Marinilabiliales bacterium]